MPHNSHLKSVTPLRAIGDEGEDSASRYLKKQGFKIIERNFFCRVGELDIIAEKKGELHFIEVKTRRTLGFGDPLEAVTPWKQKRVSQTAKYYLLKNAKWNNHPKCFSVMSIYDPGNDDAQIEFIPNAFEVWGDYY
ncbi:MAG: YraN family protein [Deltaproteobacteria bacterium]|nr:YraN family protein [Deltaproteobacteria bacterium]